MLAPMGRSARLDADTIVGEAIALLQESGFEAVSLRRLAARLDARAPSLARHVGDKARLVSLMSSRIFGEALADIAPGRTGAAWLEAFGWALWRKQMATRDIARLLAFAAPDPEIDRRSIDRLDAIMAAAELAGRTARLQQSAIQALVTGWVTFAKSARARVLGADMPVEERLAESMRALIAGFSAIEG